MHVHTSQFCSHTYPKLFQPLSSSVKAIKRQEEDSYIPLPEVTNNNELLNHEQFQNIQQQFLTDIAALRQLVQSYVNDRYNRQINTFYKKIKNIHEYQNADLLLIFNKTRHEIHKIVLEIAKPHNNECHDYIANFLHACLEDMDYCFAGVASRFNFSISNLKILEAKLQGFIYNIRHELVQEFISKFTFEQVKQGFLNKYLGTHIHYFNAFYNLLTEPVKLNSIIDPNAPQNLSDEIITCFYESAPLHINGFSIVKRAAQYWENKLSLTLKEQNITHWETNFIPMEEMTTERIKHIDHKLFQLINSLHGTDGTKEANTINFLTMIEEIKEGYSISNFGEKIHAWLAHYFCDTPKVFSMIHTNEHTKQYIGSMNYLFFWIFNCELPLSVEESCKFDLNDHTVINLSHLTTLDFGTWSTEQLHPLLMQAVAQTKTGDDFFAFFTNPHALTQLHRLPDITRDMFFNCIVEKYIASNNEPLKHLLIKCVAQYVKKQDNKFTYNAKLNVFEDTALYEKLAQEILSDRDFYLKIIKELSLSQLLSFSCHNIEILTEAYDLNSLLNEAIALENMPFLSNLVTSTFVDDLLNEQNDYQNRLLLLFAKSNDLTAMQYLLSRPNINVNFKDEKGNTPLLHAVKKGYIDCVHALLANNNINPNEQNYQGDSPLHFAARYGQAECLKALLSSATIEVNLQDKRGWTSLHCAVIWGHTDCSKALLSYHVIEVNMQDEKRWTALHYAAHFGNLRCLEALLSFNAIEVNLQDKTGLTSLHNSACFRRLRCLEALLNFHAIEVNLQDEDGWTAIHYAAESGHTECLQALLSSDLIEVNVQDKKGKTALHYAAEAGHTESLKSLLSSQVTEVNVQNKKGWTALHFAVESGNTECLKSLLSSQVTEVNVQNKKGWTALHYAAESGHTECLKALLNCAYIEVNVQNAEGWTALHFAAMLGNKECLVQLLKHKDIDTRIKNNRQSTAQNICDKHGHLACSQLLLKIDNSKIT